MDTGTGMEQNRGLSGSSLKMIAMVAMCIDHYAATVLERQLSFGDTLSDALFILGYYGLRLVGRKVRARNTWLRKSFSKDKVAWCEARRSP